jgi:hypothetical protein
MSYATLLGGTCTLIGTSTNLVVSGLQEARYGATNPEYVFGFFTITPWGIPYAVWGKYLQVAFCKPHMRMKPAQSVPPGSSGSVEQQLARQRPQQRQPYIYALR